MDNFKLATIHELRSLLWLSDAEKEVFHEVFPDSKDWFWSSSPRASYFTFAWFVNFDLGYVCDDSKDYYYRVRLVRAGQCVGDWKYGDPAHLRYQVRNNSEYVVDNLTGLEWKREPEPGRYTWYEAKERFGGGGVKYNPEPEPNMLFFLHNYSDPDTYSVQKHAQARLGILFAQGLIDQQHLTMPCQCSIDVKRGYGAPCIPCNRKQEVNRIISDAEAGMVALKEKMVKAVEVRND